MLLPALNRARGNARENNCRSNLKQLTTAAHLYASDNNGFTTAIYPDAFGGNRWCVVYLNYLGNKKLFLCPSEPLAKWEGTWTTDNISYGLPQDIVGQYGTLYNNKARPVKMDKLVEFRGKMPMIIGESTTPGTPNAVYAAAFFINVVPVTVLQTNPAGWYPINARHNGRANLGCVDGRVVTLSVAQINHDYNTDKKYFRPRQVMSGGVSRLTDN